MDRDEFEDGDRIVHRKTRRRGRVVHDIWSVCTPDEVPVQYDGEEGYVGTDWRELVKLDLVN